MFEILFILNGLHVKTKKKMSTFFFILNGLHVKTKKNFKKNVILKVSNYVKTKNNFTKNVHPKWPPCPDISSDIDLPDFANNVQRKLAKPSGMATEVSTSEKNEEKKCSKFCSS